MDDSVTIEIEAALAIATSVVNGLEHRHGDESFDMVPIPEGRDAASPSPEFSHAREVVRCVECGDTVAILTTVSLDLSGVELLRAVADVANVAGAGHLPPDHRWQNVERPDCPLCLALDRVEGVAGPDKPQASGAD